MMVRQSVRRWPLPADAATVVHEATVVGPLSRISGGHVVVIQLEAVAGSAVHESTATLVWLLVPQTVSV